MQEFLHFLSMLLKLLFFFFSPDYLRFLSFRVQHLVLLYNVHLLVFRIVFVLFHAFKELEDRVLCCVHVKIKFDFIRNIL
jgi:hypothetical protein